MDLEKKRLEIPFISPILFLGLISLLLTISVITNSSIGKQEIMNWEVKLADEQLIYPVGKTFELHLFVLDENGEPLPDVNVITEWFFNDYSHKQVMHHIESGLFEAEKKLPEEGEWTLLVEVESKRQYYEQVLSIQAIEKY
ncbi:FixH family protein [Alkalihalobacillus trypoxylicola]|uniref:YtkA-like domain-containing protein n=1 Tax=Alkalihalobacillus trypoxylicola TaxID=519424 RepID=A0A162E5M6_9BACI|nr:FixH family protein [Alkalihalobacillus trypoxylicola]KYG31795.1 hypothetical protein AZF04_03165 [Alkalihalobacillus trypoxylicola]